MSNIINVFLKDGHTGTFKGDAVLDGTENVLIVYGDHAAIHFNWMNVNFYTIAPETDEVPADV